MPNYQAIQTQLIATMNASSLYTVYNDSIKDISVDYLAVINGFASSESVTQYLSENSGNPANISWLSTITDAPFSPTAVSKRSAALTYFTTVQNVAALATANQQIYQVTPQNNVNNIAMRRAYNQTLALLMQTILIAIQQSMYLDQLAITIRDTTIDPSLSYLKHIEIVADLTLSDINNPDLNADLNALNNYYLNLGVCRASQVV